MAKRSDNPTSAADRSARRRQRKREGILIVSLGLDEGARLALVDDGYLDWFSMDDRIAVAAAVVEALRTRDV